MNQKHHNTAAAFNGMTGLSLTPNHIALVLRLSRVGGFWDRQKDEIDVASPVATTSAQVVAYDPKIMSATLPEAVLMQPVSNQDSDGTEQCIMSRSQHHIEGMNWQINVNPIDRTDEEPPYTLHYPSCPSVAEMASYFVLYFNQSHHVHIRTFKNGSWIDRTYDNQKAVRRFLKMPELKPFYKPQSNKVEREITEQLVAEAPSDIGSAELIVAPEKNAAKRFLVTYYTGPNQTATREYKTLPTAMALAMFTNVHGQPTVTEII